MEIIKSFRVPDKNSACSMFVCVCIYMTDVASIYTHTHNTIQPSCVVSAVLLRTAYNSQVVISRV